MRFDVSYGLSVLSRFLAKPNDKFINSAKRIIKYLVKTKDLGITWKVTVEDRKAGFVDVIFGAVDVSGGRVRPRTGASERKSWSIARVHVAVAFLLGRLLERARPVSAQWQEDSKSAFLMTSTRGSLLVLGVDPFAEVRCTGFADGDCLWDLSLRQRTGDGQD